MRYGIHVFATAPCIAKTPHNVIKCLLLLPSLYWRIYIMSTRGLHDPSLPHITWSGTAVHVLKGRAVSCTRVGGSLWLLSVAHINILIHVAV